MTPLDLIQYIDNNVPRIDTSSSKILTLVAQNPDMIEWAIKHDRFNRSHMRLLEKKTICANFNTEIVRDLKYINKSQIDYFYLSKNQHPAAVELIKTCKKNIWYSMLCDNANPKAVEIIENMYMSGRVEQSHIYYNPYVRPHKMRSINLGTLAANPSASEFFLRELSHYLFSDDPMHRMIWIGLSENPHPKIVKLLKMYWQRVDRVQLASNPNPEAIDLLVDIVSDYKRLNWKRLSANPAAITYLKRHPDMIVYKFLATNPHPWAIRKFAAWYTQSNNRTAYEYMLQYNYRDPYRHQYVDMTDNGI